MPDDPLKIGGAAVRPGDRALIHLPLAGFYSHGDLPMPVHVICGKKPGPRLFVSAAIHGDEILGVEIIRRLLKLKILSKIRGALIAVPVVNVYGFITHDRYLPDRRDLNRSFPGSQKGSLASRLAHLFMTEIVAHATHGIDLHSGSNHRVNLAQIRTDLNDTQTRDLAIAFGAPVLLNSNIRDGSLRQAVADLKLPVLLYEAGEALRLEESSIRTGVSGIVSVMRFIGMLPEGPLARKQEPPLLAQSSLWIRAPESGIFRTQAPRGTAIQRHDILGMIADPFSGNEVAVRSPVSGLVIGRINLPFVNEGDALFHIAMPEKAEELIEALAQNINENDW